MSDFVLRTVLRALEEVRSFAAAVDDGVLQRMNQAERTPVATSRADRVIVAGGVNDPTAAAALAAADGVTVELNELAAICHRIETLATRANRIAARYPRPAPLDPDTRAALGLGAAEPGCTNCARLPGHGGGPRWEPIDSRLSNPVALPDGTTAWLCRWCRDRLGAWGRLPTIGELTDHHAGIRVRWPADVPAPP